MLSPGEVDDAHVVVRARPEFAAAAAMARQAWQLANRSN
jgi:hypothetical protein